MEGSDVVQRVECGRNLGRGGLRRVGEIENRGIRGGKRRRHVFQSSEEESEPESAVRALEYDLTQLDSDD